LHAQLENLLPNQQRYQLIEGSVDLVHNCLKSFQLKNLSSIYSKNGDRLGAEFNKPIQRSKQEIFTERENFGSV